MKKIVFLVLSFILARAEVLFGVEVPNYPPTIAIVLYERDFAKDPNGEVMKTALVELSKIAEKGSVVCDVETGKYWYRIYLAANNEYFYYSIGAAKPNPKNVDERNVKDVSGVLRLPLLSVSDIATEHFASMTLYEGRWYSKVRLEYLMAESDHEILGNFYRRQKQFDCKPVNN